MGVEKEQKTKKTKKNSTSLHATDCYAILRLMNDFLGFFGLPRRGTIGTNTHRSKHGEKIRGYCRLEYSLGVKPKDTNGQNLGDL